jgi:hypothetical protein
MLIQPITEAQNPSGTSTDGSLEVSDVRADREKCSSSRSLLFNVGDVRADREKCSSSRSLKRKIRAAQAPTVPLAISSPSKTLQDPQVRKHKRDHTTLILAVSFWVHAEEQTDRIGFERYL